MTSTWLRTLFLVALAAVLLVACGLADDGAHDTQAAVRTSSVRVEDNNFEPAAVKVAAGDTVTWEWRGDNDHNVAGDAFESPTQRDGTFRQRFDAPGTYAYHCTLHAGMRGTIVVEGAASAS